MKRFLILSIATCLFMNAKAQIVNEGSPIPISKEMLENSAIYKAATPSVSNYIPPFINVPPPQKTQKSNVNYVPFVGQFGDLAISTQYAAPIIGMTDCIWGQSYYSSIATLFPDSSAVSHVAFVNNLSQSINRPYFQAMGFTFDPYSWTYGSGYERLFPNNNSTAICGYRIDSLTIYGDYRIANYNPNSPDTLRVFITSHSAYNSQDPLVSNEYFRLKLTNFYDTKCVVPTVKYNDINNIHQKGSVVKPAASNLLTVDYILSPQDSIVQPPGYIWFKPMKLLANYEVPVGSVTSIVMKFIPGYSYTNKDTIKKEYYNSATGGFIDEEIRKNVFSLNTIDPDYFEELLDWGDGFNCRLIESKGIRYNTSNDNNDPTYNPLGLNAYAWNYYPIPYVIMKLSTGDDWWNPNQPLYSIKGRVTENGTPLDSVKITCSNGRIAFTNANGEYTITAVPNTKVTITPSLSGYTFNPPDILYNPISSNLINQNFAASLFTHAVKGKVIDKNGSPLAGVTINCTNGDSVLTDANGEYTIAVVDKTTVTLTPNLPGYAFTPQDYTCPNVTTNLTGKDFIASKICNIQGRVTYKDGIPIGGFTINYTNGRSVVTNANGEYTIIVDTNETLTVTPVLSGYLFTPRFITYENISSDFIGQDFVAAKIYTISGKVTLNGNPFAGVTITCLNITADSTETAEITDANGEYIVAVDSNATVTLTPNLSGYTFIPKSMSYADLSWNSTLNFTATSTQNIPDIPNKSSIVIYPNPTTGELRITNYGLQIEKIEITDITGRVINSYHFNSPIIDAALDISELQNGMYFMTFHSEGRKITKKLVKY